MPRYLIPLLLVIAVALTGCDNGNKDDTAGADSDASATPTDGATSETPGGDTSGSTPSQTPEPRPTTAPVTSDAFCEGIRPIITAQDGDRRGKAAMDLLAGGLPAEMSDKARAGLQVLVDLSPYFSDTTELFRSYYALGDADKESVHAFAGYVMTECGMDLVKDLVPKLPKDLVSELPSELASLLPAS